MGRAKEIIVKVIPSKIANEFVKKHHYSGKVVNNSTVHFGCFLDGKLHGVMSYGSPLDKRKVLPLVQPSLWNEMLELNRMAFDDYLPKYSESRCFSISVKLLKKNAPHIKWILSFSDGTQCGDGAIYRASGFYLTGINKNTQVYEAPETKEVFSRMSLTDPECKGQQKKALSYSRTALTNLGGNGALKQRRDISETYGVDVTNLSGSSMKVYKEIGFTLKYGFQLRYIYLIDKTCKITVPIIPFSKIDEMGAGMYKGEKITLAERQQQARVHHKGDEAAFQPSGAFDSTSALNL
jgi:hypothetical protein